MELGPGSFGFWYVIIHRLHFFFKLNEYMGSKKYPWTLYIIMNWSHNNTRLNNECGVGRGRVEAEVAWFREKMIEYNYSLGIVCLQVVC